MSDPTFTQEQIDDLMFHAYPVNAHSRKNLLDVEANYDRI